MTNVVVINNKGGVGKTTSAVNLSAWLSKGGHKTLLIDIDPSSSASFHVGFKKTNDQRESICDYLLDPTRPLSDFIYHTDFENLWCLPSEPLLSDFIDDIIKEEDTGYFLKKENIPADYRWVIFDCPPNMHSLSINAMAISQYVIIPVQTQYSALAGLETTLRLVNRVQQHINPALKILGILATFFDKRTRISRQVLQQLREQYGAMMFETVIGINSRLSEAYNYQTPILYLDGRARGARQYDGLTKEMIKRVSLYE